MKIGFIGLGIMGSRMAANLQAAGHDLIVHNRTRAKADDLIQRGAVWADSPAAVGAQVDTVFTMLAHPEAVRSAASAFLETLPSGALWVDCSTVNPSFSREMAQGAAEKGIRFLDAPVAGSKNQAANAELVFIVGGEHVDAARPLFNVMGKNVVHVGENGMGSALKIVVNMQLAVAMASFAEGIALGRSLGIPQETLFNVLIGGPVVPPFVAGKRAKMESGDFDAEFPLQWMRKDLHLAAETAYETGAGSMLTSLAREMYGLAVNAGYGEADFSAIVDYLKDKNA